MGADYKGQEKAISELRNISEPAREFLCHHLRNELNVVIGNLLLVKSYAQVGDHVEDIPRCMHAAENAAIHVLRDLKKIGC